MKEEYKTLGTEFSKEKIYYFLFIMGIYIILFFFWNGTQETATRDLILFYLFFGAILGVLPFIIDLLIGGYQDLPLETISYENTAVIPFLNKFWVQVVFSLLLSIMIFFTVSVTGQGLVKAPILHVSILPGMTFAGDVVDAILSGLLGGVMESIVFWGFLFPTMYAFFRRQGLDEISSLVLTILFIALIFTTYHWWRYVYRITALMSVFFFAILQGIFVYALRSQVPTFCTHFTNNIAVVMILERGYRLLFAV